MTVNSRKSLAWGALAILIIAVAAGIFNSRTSQQQTTEESALILQSGIDLFNQQKHAEALAVLESIPEGSDQKWQARYYQGSALIMVKDYQPAIGYLEEALTLAPTETRIMHALGVAYYKLGNLKLSKAYYASILEIDPADEEAKGLMDIMAGLLRTQAKESGGG